MITLDTSALFAAVNRLDPQHLLMRRILLAERRPFLVPAASLGEIGYLVEQRLQASVMDNLLLDLQRGGWTLDCGDQDLERIRALARRYADLPLGLVDAAVIACAERNGGRVLTLDFRHFGVVARRNHRLGHGSGVAALTPRWRGRP